MTKLSEFSRAAAYVERLRRLRKFRQAYGNGDSSAKHVLVSLVHVRDEAAQQQQQYPRSSLSATDHPGPLFLSTASRAALNQALESEEAAILAELRTLGVTIDMDLPL